MSDSTIPQRPPLPANWDGPSKFTLTMQSILRQYVDNYDYFVKSLPTAIIMIPLALFFLSPNESRGIYLFGAIFTVIVGLIFTPSSGGEHFMNNYPSFHGLVIGYAVGYLLMENIILEKAGSMLSSGVMGLLLLGIVSGSLKSNNSGSKQMLYIGIGWLLGIVIGMFFSYAEFKTLNPNVDKEIESKEKESKEKEEVFKPI